MSKKRKISPEEEGETKADRVPSPAVFSNEHVTNYLRWSLATASESKDNWFKLGRRDQKTEDVFSVDPTKYKQEKLAVPTEIPALYLQLIGSSLLERHREYVRLQREVGITEVCFLIEECTAQFNPPNMPSLSGKIGLLWRIMSGTKAAEFKTGKVSGNGFLALPEINVTNDPRGVVRKLA